MEERQRMENVRERKRVKAYARGSRASIPHVNCVVSGWRITASRREIYSTIDIDIDDTAAEAPAVAVAAAGAWREGGKREREKNERWVGGSSRVFQVFQCLHLFNPSFTLCQLSVRLFFLYISLASLRRTFNRCILCVYGGAGCGGWGCFFLSSVITRSISSHTAARRVQWEAKKNEKQNNRGRKKKCKGKIKKKNVKKVNDDDDDKQETARRHGQQ